MLDFQNQGHFRSAENGPKIKGSYETPDELRNVDSGVREFCGNQLRTVVHSCA